MKISKKDLKLVQKYINKGAITPICEGGYRISDEHFSFITGIGGCIEFCKEAEKFLKKWKQKKLKLVYPMGMK